ncbi:recombinase family protein [Flintibacter sp.]|uniref:recombinase family protein n=1 Tax=Flintibacter sp. TaxID=1918624 RepID=UPI0034A0BD8F
MMGNRKQPFGYRVIMGEIVIHPQETELVEHIFRKYLAGATFSTLVEELREQSIPYSEGKVWNKIWWPGFWRMNGILESMITHQ